MAKLSAKMQAMHLRMAKAHSLKAHARDLAAYHGEMRAIQADLIRAEIELQADLAEEGFHAHGHPYHMYYNHHHHKRPFAEETNHTDELNHVVHDEVYDPDYFHVNAHMFDDLDIPSLSQPCPSTYRHSANGGQKMELARSNSAQLRESYHGGHPTQVHHVPKHPQLAHQHVADAAPIGMVAPNASHPMTGHSGVGKTEMKTVVVTAVPGDFDRQGQSSDQPESKRRRTAKRNPTRPSHIPWTKEESEAFKKLVADEGPSKWEDKATKLGTGRTAKALHTRWMRDQGRIIDKPRLSTKKSKATVTQTGIAEPPPPPPPSVPVPCAEAAAPLSTLAAAPAPSPAPAQQQTIFPAESTETVADASLVKTEMKTEPTVQVKRDSASVENNQK